MFHNIGDFEGLVSLIEVSGNFAHVVKLWVVVVIIGVDVVGCCWFCVRVAIAKIGQGALLDLVCVIMF